MPEHDIIREEDGFVVCRCGLSYSGESTGEAQARHRIHFEAMRRSTDRAAVEGIAASRAALEGRTDGS